MNHETKKKIRVLFLVSTLARQGPVRQLCNQLKYTDTKKFEPRILTLSPEPEDSLLPRFRDLGIACHSLGLSRVAGLFLAFSRLKQFLRDHPTDVVHSSGLRADVFAALALSEMPLVSTLHESALFEYSIMAHGSLLGRLIDSIHLFALRRFERVVFLTDHIRQKMQRGCGLFGEVIYNGVDEDTFNPTSPDERMVIRDRLRLPREGPVLISIGHLVRLKDPFTALQGFLASQLAKSGVMVFLGDGPLKSACKELANPISNVRIVGRVQSVNEYLKAADVFVSTSLIEACPMAVLEALACGLPVVLSDIESHREISAFDPMAGRLFPVKDVSALARTLEDVMNADYESMRKAAIDVVRHHLNARRMSAEYQALYRRLYDEHKRQS